MNRHERYNQSEKGKARYKRYETSTKGVVRRLRYDATTRRVRVLTEQRTRVVGKLKDVREEIEWLTRSLELAESSPRSDEPSSL